MNELKKVINADLNSLFEMKTQNTLHSKEAKLYRDVKMSYLEGDHEKLKDITNYIVTKNLLCPKGIQACLLRLYLETEQVTQEELEGFSERIGQDESLWSGEVNFLIAYGYEVYIKDYYLAKTFYQRSYQIFNSAKVYNKALISLHNFIMAEGNIYPNRKQMADLNFLLNKAREHNVKKVEALCLMNLSWEFTKTGANYSALKKIEEALILAHKHEGEALQLKCLAHKGRILLKLDKLEEVKLILDKLKSSKMKEIIGMRKRLVQKLKEKLKSTQLNQEKTTPEMALPPTWITNNGEMTQQLGKLENQLVEFLSDGPKTKDIIIKHLYGTSIDYYALENRFKSLLVRIRKKYPELIEFSDGHYRIPDEFTIKDDLDDVS